MRDSSLYDKTFTSQYTADLIIPHEREHRFVKRLPGFNR